MELECPFCHEGKVEVFHKESYMQAKKSHIAAGDKVSFHRRPDTYEVLEDCPKCGEKAKVIQEAYETGTAEPISHEERIKRFRKEGIPTRIEM